MKWFVACLALALSLSAHAGRLTPSSRLSAQTLTSGAHTSSTFTIPTGATTALIGFCLYNDTGGAGTTPTSVSINGTSAPLIDSTSNNLRFQIALYKATGFGTGSSKTIAYTLGSTGVYFAMNIAVEYFDGTATFGGHAATDAAGDATATTSALSNTSGDLLLSTYCGNRSYGTMTAGSGQTDLDQTDDGSQAHYGFTTETGTGSSDAQAITGTNPAIAATVVTFATGGFDSLPSISGRTTTAFTVGGSLSGAGTVKAVACHAGSATPSIAEINAATCASGATPDASGNQSPSSPPYDFSISLTVSQSPAFPIYDVYATDGTTRSALTNSFLSAPSTCGASSNQACQFKQLTSVAIGGIASVATLPYDNQTQNFIVGDTVTGGTSSAHGQIMSDSDGGASGTLTLWISSGTFVDNETLTGALQGSALVNGSATALYAANDVLVAPTYVSPGGASVTMTIGADGNVSYSSGSEVETAYNIKVYDYSAIGYASGDIDMVNNDHSPSCFAGTHTIVLRAGTALTRSLHADCTDSDGDAITSSVLSGTLPNGLTHDGSTNITSGTPTTVGTSSTIRYLVYDIYGAPAINDVVYDVQSGAATATVPNCLAKTVTQCIALISTASSYAQISRGTSCTSDSLEIYSQSPAKNTKAAYNFTLTTLCR